MQDAESQKTPADTVATNFEPRITAFVCKWCTYAGADLAGTSRTQYPPNVRVIKLPCTGRIDIAFVLRAFLQGADGVIVSGCHPGDCHYTAGNYRARRRWTLFRDLLDFVGFDLQRFDCAWISAAEGSKWARTVGEFTEKIRSLGPYTEMREVAEARTPEPAPASVSNAGGSAAESVPAASPADLGEAIKAAFAAGKVKAVVGWTASRTLGRICPHWIIAADRVQEIVPAGGAAANLARLLKHSRLRGIRPLGMLVRPAELRALNVLRQEAQLRPADLVLFVLAGTGKYLGVMDWEAAARALCVGQEQDVAGFSPDLLQQVDGLAAKPRAERWAFWRAEFERCIKCYACRGSCPMCGCEQCMADKNQPQWWPTAADGAGNLGWHIVRAFHLAGRCVGCGACQAACPAGLQINLLGAAMARSALRHFGHHAGADPEAVPLLADWNSEDTETFIL